MDVQIEENNVLHLCNVCNLYFDNNTDLIQHTTNENCTKKNKKILQKQTKHKKKNVKHYCDICCKNFASLISFKAHMKAFHGESNLKKDGSIFKSKSYFFVQKKTIDGIGSSDIFNEFENQMPLELKNDQFRCNVCNKVFDNSVDFVGHEKTHYQTLVNGNSSISHNSVTLDDNMDLNTYDDDENGTIANASNNDQSLNILNDDCTIASTSNNDDKSLNILDDGTIADASDNDKSLNILDDDCTIASTFNNDGTIADASNNDKSLNILDNDGTIAGTSNNYYESLNILNDGYTSSDIFSNGSSDESLDFYDSSNLDASNNKIMCNSNEGVFTIASDFEEHQQYNIDDNLRIFRNQTNLIFCEPNEDNIDTNTNSYLNSNVKSPQKDSWIPDENHMKALNEICVDQQPFDCEICHETCEQFDHYQIHQWCSFNEILKCNVCNQKFSDKEELNLHEYEHVKTHFC
ncbi:uncharacterized protein DDB_G0283357-like [Melanaphis sacchari]|uniref:uncharacterized protein DDB_G0283357-like n=1 Tax=Melanaphis sacchari TaxID=742174 RepID=UPI000DC14C65|nr:uncharacterized protein DDB_G0283357-like [Melanaphis sacchari]